MSFFKGLLGPLVPSKVEDVTKKVGDKLKGNEKPLEQRMTDATIDGAAGLAGKGWEKIVGAPTVEQRERNNLAVNAVLERLYGFAQGGQRTTEQSVNSLSTNFLIEPFDNPTLLTQHNANIAQVAVFNAQIEAFMSTGNVVGANPIISQRNNLISYFNGRILNLKEIIVDRNTYNELNGLVKAKGITLAALSTALPSNVLQMLRNVCVESRGITGRVSRTFLEVPTK
jgi:hypothetical protein